MVNVTAWKPEIQSAVNEAAGIFGRNTGMIWERERDARGVRLVLPGEGYPTKLDEDYPRGVIAQETGSKPIHSVVDVYPVNGSTFFYGGREYRVLWGLP